MNYDACELNEDYFEYICNSITNCYCKYYDADKYF